MYPNLHVKGNAHSAFKVTHKDLAEVAHKWALCDHSVAVAVKEFKESLANDTGQIAVLDECHLINALLFEIWLAIGYEAPKSEILI